MACTICKASADALAELFKGTIRLLAASKVFPARMMAAVDGSKIRTTRYHEGCGQIAATPHKRKHHEEEPEAEELCFGWRLIALVDLVTLTLVATKIVQIQEQEGPHLLGLLEQAQQNLGTHSRITTLVMDRAYVDGPTLYKLGSKASRGT